MTPPEEGKSLRGAELIAEFLERRNRGEEVDPEELLLAHPDLADEIAESLSGLRVLDQMLAAHSDLPGAGDVVGDFRLDREIGRGGYSTVFEAVQLSMGRRVALKILPKATLPAKRMQREVETAGRLNHPHIVPLLATGHGEGYFWIAMVLAGGGTLASLLGKVRGVPPAERGPDLLLARSHDGREPSRGDYFRRVAEITVGIAEALQHAHDHGILHRDVKPSNVVFSDEGAARLVDFGLAAREGSEKITRVGEMLGTPAYLPPEVIEGEEGAPSARSDIYSLGATLYEMLVLAPPHTAATTRGLLASIVSKEPVRPRRLLNLVPRDLETITLQCLEKDPKQRYDSAADLASDLRRFLMHEPIRARQPGFWARTARLARNNRVATSFCLLSAVLLVALSTQLVRASFDVRDRRARVFEAELETVSRNTLEIEGAMSALEQLEGQLYSAREARMRPGQTANEEALFVHTEDAYAKWLTHVESLTRFSERSLTRVSTMNMRGRAQEIDASRADLYLARWRLARAIADRAAERRYRLLTLSFDDGSRRAEIEATGTVRVGPVGSGPSTFYLHRYAPQFRIHSGGDMRLVPLPCDRHGRFLVEVDERRELPEITEERPGWLPGDTVLRVDSVGGASARAGLLPGDWIIDVEGAPAGLGTFLMEPARSVDGEVLAPALAAVARVNGWSPKLAAQVSILADPDASPDPVTVRFAGRAGPETSVPRAAVCGWSIGRLDELLSGGDGLPRGVTIRVRRGLDDLRFELPGSEPLQLAVSRESYPAYRLPQNELAGDEEASLPPGSYLLVFARTAGVSRPERVAVRIEPGGAHRVDPRSGLRSRVPDGFVLVTGGMLQSGGDLGALAWRPRERIELGDYAMMRHEVSWREYIGFLDVLGGSAPDEWLPRNGDTGRRLVRMEDGRWRRTDELEVASLDVPVVGVSRAAAIAYAEHWNRSVAAREGWSARARLPRRAEFEWAGRGPDGRVYPFGDFYSYRFTNGGNSYFGVEIPARRGDFPADESVFGVRSLAGGVEEWLLDDTYAEGVGLAAGGSYRVDHEGRSRPSNAYRVRVDECSTARGFRLVLDLE